MLYAIVDIETTGGHASGHGIIEICIKICDKHTIIDEFETLVNPRQSIPKYIQGLTGISDEMVADAPGFEKIAPKVYELLHDKIFIAHNVNFDYSFIKCQLEAEGYSYNAKRLCTIRLARNIFPNIPSYSLGNLCTSLNIPHYNRHRAGGDATATAILFHKMLAHDHKDFISTSLKRNSQEQTLPPNVPKEHFTVLPDTPGVYYFHDNKQRVIYVGKAKNIKKRVFSHFAGNSEGRKKQDFLRHVRGITYQSTATELMASILESTEIKKLWPVYNVSQKNAEDNYGIFVYEDRAGYMRLAIEKKRRNSNPVYTFHYKVDGHGVLRKLVQQFSLCPKLCFIQTDKSDCTGIAEGHCNGACTKKEDTSIYNERVREAIASLTHKPSYMVLDKGLTNQQQSCIMVVNGSFFGMGYLPKNTDIVSEDVIKQYIKPYKENSFIRSLLNTYITKFPAQIRMIMNDHSSTNFKALP